MKKILLTLTAVATLSFANSEIVSKDLKTCENGLIVKEEIIDAIGKIANIEDAKYLNLNYLNSWVLLKNGLINEKKEIFEFDKDFDEDFMKLLRYDSRMVVGCMRNNPNLNEKENFMNLKIQKLTPETQKVLKDILIETSLEYWLELSSGGMIITQSLKNADFTNIEELTKVLEDLRIKNNSHLKMIQILLEKDKFNQIKQIQENQYEKVKEILNFRGEVK